MSDKHTDALLPCPMPDCGSTLVGTGMLPCKVATVSCGQCGTSIQGEDGTVEAAKARWNMAIRATEGQAQTSAACPDCYGQGSFIGSLDGYDDADCHTCDGSGKRAAQLADSTAPGVWSITKHCDMGTVLDAAGNRIATTYAADAQRFVDAHNAAPTAQQSLTAGGAVPDERAAFETWHRSRFATRHSTGQPTRDMHNGIYAEEYGPEHQQQMWEAWQARAKLAAAPLPQVQSEALDEAPIECWSADQEDFNATELDSLLTMREELKPGDTVWVGEAVRPEPSQLIDADDIMTTMGERAYDIAGEHAEDYPEVSKEAEQELNTLLAAWIGKHASPSFWTVANIRPYVLSHDDFPDDPTPVQCELPAADQQPVTPSGALADNDGGVA